jgi:hypothetical protein
MGPGPTSEAQAARWAASEAALYRKEAAYNAVSDVFLALTVIAFVMAIRCSVRGEKSRKWILAKVGACLLMLSGVFHMLGLPHMY